MPNNVNFDSPIMIWNCATGQKLNLENYQTSNEPFRLEIDVITREIKDSFYNSETKSYSYENPKPTFLSKLTKWITK
jgi:hypothetical protein